MGTRKADRQARRQATQANSADGPPSELVIRLKERHLRWTSLEEAFNHITDNRLQEYEAVRFDFSRVTELIGPWGIHFAMLIWLEHAGRRSGHGQWIIGTASRHGPVVPEFAEGAGFAYRARIRRQPEPIRPSGCLMGPQAA